MWMNEGFLLLFDFNWEIDCEFEVAKDDFLSMRWKSQMLIDCFGG